MYTCISSFNPYNNLVRLILLLFLLSQLYRERNKLIEVKHFALDLTTPFHKSFP